MENKRRKPNKDSKPSRGARGSSKARPATKARRSSGSDKPSREEKPSAEGRPYRDTRPSKDGKPKRKAGTYTKAPLRKADPNKKSKNNPHTKANDGKTRLNKFLAQAGIASRREADTLIAAGVVKVNGVVVMYVPYIVLPIKKERESGLLFPKIKFDSNEGVHFGIPYFWAMSEHSDLTFTPEIRGKRGVSGELQFRQALRGETWLELNTIGVSDRVWDPGKDDYEVSGAHSQRVGGELEFHSFLDNTVSFHATVSGLSDLDQVRDLQDFYDDRVRSSDLGIESFLNIKLTK